MRYLSFCLIVCLAPSAWAIDCGRHFDSILNDLRKFIGRNMELHQNLPVITTPPKEATQVNYAKHQAKPVVRCSTKGRLPDCSFELLRGTLMPELDDSSESLGDYNPDNHTVTFRKDARSRFAVIFKRLAKQNACKDIWLSIPQSFGEKRTKIILDGLRQAGCTGRRLVYSQPVKIPAPKVSPAVQKILGRSDPRKKNSAYEVESLLADHIMKTMQANQKACAATLESMHLKSSNTPSLLMTLIGTWEKDKKNHQGCFCTAPQQDALLFARFLANVPTQGQAYLLYAVPL